MWIAAYMKKVSYYEMTITGDFSFLVHARNRKNLYICVYRQWFAVFAAYSAPLCCILFRPFFILMVLPHTPERANDKNCRIGSRKHADQKRERETQNRFHIADNCHNTNHGNRQNCGNRSIQCSWERFINTTVCKLFPCHRASIQALVFTHSIVYDNRIIDRVTKNG